MAIHNITNVNQGLQQFTVNTVDILLFPFSSKFVVSSSTGNNGVYTITNAIISGSEIILTVAESIPDPTINGQVQDGSYLINYSSNLKPEFAIAPLSSNSSTSLTLPGRQLSNYGEYLNENMIHMLEHFYGPSAPSNPTGGQLWFNTNVSKLQVYDGTWSDVTPAGSDPTIIVNGTSKVEIPVANGNIEVTVNGILRTLTTPSTTLFTVDSSASSSFADGIQIGTIGGDNGIRISTDGTNPGFVSFFNTGNTTEQARISYNDSGLEDINFNAGISTTSVPQLRILPTLINATSNLSLSGASETKRVFFDTSVSSSPMTMFSKINGTAKEMHFLFTNEHNPAAPTDTTPMDRIVFGSGSTYITYLPGGGINYGTLAPGIETNNSGQIQNELFVFNSNGSMQFVAGGSISPQISTITAPDYGLRFLNQGNIQIQANTLFRTTLEGLGSVFSIQESSGKANAVISGSLTLNANTGYFKPNSLTTLERDTNLSPTGGEIIYNETESSPQYYNGVTWNNFSTTSLLPRQVAIDQIAGNVSVVFSSGNPQAINGSNVYTVNGLQKRIDSNWVFNPTPPPGGVGGLDVGTAQPDTPYYCYTIQNLTTGVGDFLITASVPTLNTKAYTGLNMPVGWGNEDYIGAIHTNSLGNIRNGIYTYGDGGYDFLYEVPVDTGVTTALPTSALVTLACPANSLANVILHARIDGTPSPTYEHIVRVYPATFVDSPVTIINGQVSAVRNGIQFESRSQSSFLVRCTSLTPRVKIQSNGTGAQASLGTAGWREFL